ncbi:MAG: dipeptidase [Flavobacteriaceae bacterium]|nr:MAG: dipeptidase [Flavobacteriaceae bacterium]
MKNIETYIENNKDRFVSELFSLLKIPSVSADSTFSDKVKDCAQAVCQQLQAIGVDEAQVYSTPGHPIVFGQKMIDPKLPTLLVYGHYDVQPADPLELWDTDPFEPTIKITDIHPDGAIFARGSADDKGQFFMHIKAFEAMEKTGELPCNFKFLIEGEEEVGSIHLEEFIKSHKEMLSNDLIVISDTEMIAQDQPTICTGLRGLSYLEVEVTGPDLDLHSGVYGGAVPNPINILSKMIASLHQSDGKVSVKGFYDGVLEESTQSRAQLNAVPFSLEEFKNSIGIADIVGEEGYTTIERTGIRPTLDVNGIWGGYTGEGAKTVIPSKAFAKISMRLVPGQDPDKITQKFVEHFQSIAPPSVKVKCTPHHGGWPYVLPEDHFGYRAAKIALKEGFGKEALPLRGGGSIPIVALFEKVFLTKTVLLGFGLNSDVIHSPNENFGLRNFFKGIQTLPIFYRVFSELKMGKM